MSRFCFTTVKILKSWVNIQRVLRKWPIKPAVMISWSLWCHNESIHPSILAGFGWGVSMKSMAFVLDRLSNSQPIRREPLCNRHPLSHRWGLCHPGHHGQLLHGRYCGRQEFTAARDESQHCRHGHAQRLAAVEVGRRSRFYLYGLTLTWWVSTVDI